MSQHLSSYLLFKYYPYLTIIIVFFWYTQMINMFRATNELPWYRTASRSPEPLLFIQEKGQKSPHKKSITQLDYLYFNIQTKENYWQQYATSTLCWRQLNRQMDVLVRLGKSAENWARWDGRLTQVISMKSGKVCNNLYCREVIVQGSVRWPNGLALDMVLDRYIHENKSQRVLWKSILRLYWVDAKLSTIGSSALDGSEVFFVLQISYLSYFIYLTRKWSDPSAIVQARIILFSTSTLRHPFSIAVFEDFM